jgi:DNA-binding NarL/FixJ family response regulator
VILLDLNMPVMNGLEFLGELREDPALRDATVFILTTSQAESDIAEGYRRNVAGYMIKSNVGDSFMEAVKLIESYWRVVELPESTDARLV